MSKTDITISISISPPKKNNTGWVYTVPTAGIFVQCWVPTSCSGSRAELVVGKGVKTAMVKVWEKVP